MAQEDLPFPWGGLGMTDTWRCKHGKSYGANRWNFEALFRYIANPRWAFQNQLLRREPTQVTLEKRQNVFPEERHSALLNYALRAGRNGGILTFFNYGMGETYRKLKTHIPLYCCRHRE